MKLSNKIYTILCDDIRSEEGNKLSLMGIYSREMIFKEIPAMLPKISLAIFMEEIKEYIPEMKIKFTIPKADPITMSLPPPPDQKIGMHANFGFSFAPFKVSASGDAKIEIRFGEERRPTIVHKFNIKVAKQNKT